MISYKINCNFNFSLQELVRHDENSLTFSSETELADQLKSWFKDFPNNEENNDKYNLFKTNLKSFQQVRWHDNWKNQVLPYFVD